MKIFYKVLLSVLLLSGTVYAQDFAGLRTSNYAGVSGIDLNPASIADSRYNLDINVFGGSFSLYNNYLAIKPEAFKRPFSENSAFNDTAFFDNFVTERVNDKDKQFTITNNIYLPSFMYSITERDAVALTWRVRSIMNTSGISPELAKLAIEDFDDESLFDIRFNDTRFNIQSMTWAEYGLGYARTVYEKDAHFVKAGGRLKMIQGLQAAYVFIDDLSYEFSNSDTISFFQTDISYGHSDNFDINGDEVSYNFTGRPTVAFDLGAVWEWRPDREKYKYEKTEGKFVYRKDQNKYKAKVGFSLTDVGRIKFTKGGSSQNIRADFQGLALDTFDVEDLDAFDSVLTSIFVITEEAGQTFTMALPTAFSLQIDYNIWKDFYINLTPVWSLKRPSNDTKIAGQTIYFLTPRYDHKWFGAFVPITIDDMDNFNYGFAFRAGPLIAGSRNIKPILRFGDTYGADFFLGLKIPIMYGKPKKLDKALID